MVFNNYNILDLKKKIKKGGLFNLNVKNENDESSPRSNLMKIGNKNQGILKRIKKNSDYSFKKMEKDYLINQYYKKNLCIFPSIDFNKKKDISLRKIGNYKIPVSRSSKISPIRVNRVRNISLPSIIQNDNEREQFYFYK
jgi:hypothetical protein